MTTRRFWAIAVADLRMVDWYANAFDLAPIAHMDPAADGSKVIVMGNDDLVIEFKQREAHVDRVAAADGYFKVGWFAASVDRARTQLVERGAAPMGPVVDQPEFGIRFCLVADPEGNLIQVFEQL